MGECNMKKLLIIIIALVAVGLGWYGNTLKKNIKEIEPEYFLRAESCDDEKIEEGNVVYVAGANGSLVCVSLVYRNIDVSARIIGIAIDDIEKTKWGYIKLNK